jgi:nitric oxide reductase NorE protein
MGFGPTGADIQRMTSTPADAVVPASPLRALADPPGGVLLWLIVALELLAFTMIFGIIAWLRVEAPELFREAQAHLDTTSGLALTVALLTSGWLVAEGVHAFRGGDAAAARRWWLAGVAAGTVFVGLKVRDYAVKSAAGHGLGANDFWDAYVLGTGFHFVHVLAGLVLLTVVAWRLPRARFEDPETAVAGVALFWHMCDLAWLFLFPLFWARA